MSQHSKEKKANRLIHATSPYLIQHAYNPVNWFEWGSEALSTARTENKPVLVSIGYAACHWCHVMERESFETDYIADIMNEHFVCIKVDREERPDIDQVYMEAVQAMGLNGGWPLNVFLTPEQKPFYGGTYFPPQNWAQLLLQVGKVFQLNRSDIEQKANELSQHLQVSDLQRFSSPQQESGLKPEELTKMFDQLASRYDTRWGGMDKSPKFLMPSIWQFLARYYFVFRTPAALEMVSQTLIRVSQGGIYDQIGGGFARYSVDGEWFAPHFEKMLYDNAQLLSLYSEAYTASKNSDFRKIVLDTVSWIERDMRHPEGGFYSALDADSEGEEGKYYTWTLDEIRTILGDKTEEVAAYFHVAAGGNWEHGRNILKRSDDDPIWKFDSEKKALLAARSQRIPPSLDDKILAGWNAMTIKGLADAYGAFGEENLLHLAKSAMQFIENYLVFDGKLYRSFRNTRSQTEGFLEDYAYLIQGYIALYDCTFDESFLFQAEAWSRYTMENFFDPGDGFFHFAANHAEPLIARKKEIFDNVIPASNSVMARNLYRLGTMLDDSNWKSTAVTMMSKLLSTIQTEPAYLSNWGILALEIFRGMHEVVIVGPDALEVRAQLARHHLPFAQLMGAVTSSDLSLFEGRTLQDGKTRIYVCFQRTCQLPVETVSAALDQLVSG